MIQRNSLLLFCCLVVAACTTTVPSASRPRSLLPRRRRNPLLAESLLVVDPSKKMVCRTVTPTGTGFQRRVCATQAEWDGISRLYGCELGAKELQTGYGNRSRL